MVIMAIIEYSNKEQGDLQLTPHFKVWEFACKDGTDSILINEELCPAMERLFELLSLSKIIVNSGYRTPSHSKSVGGYETDQHTKGNAADIVCYAKNGSKIPSAKICCALETLGHNGGVGYTNDYTVHVDVRGKKIWFDERYGNKIIDSWYAYFTEVPRIGDVNQDGIITAEDARLALQASAQIITLDEKQTEAADMDADGTVSAADARTILRLSARII
jgi:hypothetical protein